MMANNGKQWQMAVDDGKAWPTTANNGKGWQQGIKSKCTSKPKKKWQSTITNSNFNNNSNSDIGNTAAQWVEKAASARAAATALTRAAISNIYTRQLLVVITVSSTRSR